MVGAHKIDETTDDLERLQELFDQGLNNCQIHRIYRTNKGEQISRIHISHIRSGRRWNVNNRSFLMKTELQNLDSVTTDICGEQFKTEIGCIVSESSLFYIYLRYKGQSQIQWDNDIVLLRKPTTEDLLRSHNQFVYETVSSLC